MPVSVSASCVKHIPSAAELKLDVQHANSAATTAANQLRDWYDALLPIRQGTPYQETLEDAMRKMDSILYQLRRAADAVSSSADDDVQAPTLTQGGATQRSITQASFLAG
jgi:hypothetical protein